MQVLIWIFLSSRFVQVISGIFLSSSLVQVISGTSIPRQFPAGIIRKGSVRSRVLRFRLRDARLLAASRFNSPLRAQTWSFVAAASASPAHGILAMCPDTSSILLSSVQGTLPREDGIGLSRSLCGASGIVSSKTSSEVDSLVCAELPVKFAVNFNCVNRHGNLKK